MPLPMSRRATGPALVSETVVSSWRLLTMTTLGRIVVSKACSRLPPHCWQAV